MEVFICSLFCDNRFCFANRNDQISKASIRRMALYINAVKRLYSRSVAQPHTNKNKR
jgi:hypothetical protein